MYGIERYQFDGSTLSIETTFKTKHIEMNALTELYKATQGN